MTPRISVLRCGLDSEKAANPAWHDRVSLTIDHDTPDLMASGKYGADRRICPRAARPSLVGTAERPRRREFAGSVQQGELTLCVQDYVPGLVQEP